MGFFSNLRPDRARELARARENLAAAVRAAEQGDLAEAALLLEAVESSVGARLAEETSAARAAIAAAEVRRAAAPPTAWQRARSELAALAVAPAPAVAD